MHTADLQGLTNYLTAEALEETVVCTNMIAIAILWEISTELAMEAIRHTGNTPGIHFNGALKMAGSYNSRVRAMALERGY